ncbi:MAG: GNAT family N-acetyltransferase [Bacteroidota bacterium]
MNLTITTVQSDADIQGILALQQQNLTRNLSAEVQLSQGFLTVAHDPAVLARMNAAAPSIIAKDGEQVVGYCLTMLPAFKADVPALVPLFDLLDTLTYKAQPLNQYAYYVMGQVCVAEGFRGQGLFDAMYHHHHEIYGDRYQLLVTDISGRNTRSLRAHLRVGFEALQTFDDPFTGELWTIVVWDWAIV